eukprot:6182414-Pleurochrysis_carterae.AAC.1
MPQNASYVRLYVVHASMQHASIVKRETNTVKRATKYLDWQHCDEKRIRLCATVAQYSSQHLDVRASVTLHPHGVWPGAARRWLKDAQRCFGREGRRLRGCGSAPCTPHRSGDRNRRSKGPGSPWLAGTPRTQARLRQHGRCSACLD